MVSFYCYNFFRSSLTARSELVDFYPFKRKKLEQIMDLDKGRECTKKAVSKRKSKKLLSENVKDHLWGVGGGFSRVSFLGLFCEFKI